ncbi:SHOCT domain-containing protein [Salinigranum halophilum]|uniref:SHOCT domain-containing protein n=1 Tax=Salinigranum halophilum TaxID=2565931 RepID=UPI0010A87C94|nr:SHOCT domain-containing protein [Salinigranum halophilum]
MYSLDTLTALAQWGPHPGPHPGPHAPMGPAGGGGFGTGMAGGTWGVGGGFVLTLVLLLLLAAVIVGVAYLLSTRIRTEDSRDDDALAVLERRYARGEVDDEEFERRRGRLDGGVS